MRLIGNLRVLATAATLTVLTSASAVADAATHTISIRTQSYDNADCGSDGCTTACQIWLYVTASDFVRRPTPYMAINLYYLDPHYKGGETSFQFNFEGVTKAHPVEVTDSRLGQKCDQIVISRVTANCPTEVGSKCLGFYYFQLPDVPEIGLASQKVEAE